MRFSSPQSLIVILAYTNLLINEVYIRQSRVTIRVVLYSHFVAILVESDELDDGSLLHQSA